MAELVKGYQKMLEDEQKLTAEQLMIANVGKLNAKKHLEEEVENLISSNVVQTLGSMIDSVVF
jgi:26S proteasome regulatory subunit N11